MQQWGSVALGQIAFYGNAGAEAVVVAGGVAAVVRGMQAHVRVASVKSKGSFALGHIVGNSYAGIEAVVAAGGVAAVVGGMQAHVRLAEVQELGSWALANIAFDSDAGIEAGACGRWSGGSCRGHAGACGVGESAGGGQQSMQGRKRWWRRAEWQQL